MIYPYRCPSCGRYEEVVKPMVRAQDEEKCPDCGETLARVWTIPQVVGAAVGEAEYNYGLNCVTRTAADRREALKRINGENPDQHLVECDTPLKGLKPKRERYPTASELGI